MPKVKPRELAAEANRINLEQLARLGAEVRRSRRIRRMTQAALAGLAGIARSTLSAIERGHGGGHTLDTWQRVALALERPLKVTLGREARALRFRASRPWKGRAPARAAAVRADVLTPWSLSAQRPASRR